MLEHLILDNCKHHHFDKMQFGFVESRGTNMATALLNDIGQYCNARGSTIFTFILDAEGAFDGLPHPLLLSKAIDIVPNVYWKILVYWYKKMEVYIHFNNQKSSVIPLERAMRQGGLISPWFNLFYHAMVNTLNSTIDGNNYNVFTQR